MKAIRFSFINFSGRVVKRSRSLVIRLTKNNPAMELLNNARKKVAMFSLLLDRLTDRLKIRNKKAKSLIEW